MQSLLLKLQREVEARKRPGWGAGATVRSALLGTALCLGAFLLGARTAGAGEGGILHTFTPAAPGGVVDLQQAEIERLKRITENSSRFGIPADLAERIEDIARAEGIDPALAFGLVRAESEFNHRAVSRVGAVGLTQLMPSTARYFQGGESRQALFDRDTNLRIGFRYLHSLIVKYDGDVRLALLAYNRGPDRVDQLLKAGIDPDNGYVEMVMSKKPGRTN